MPYFPIIVSFLTSVTKQNLDGSANYEASDCIIFVCRVSVTGIKNILFGILSSNALTSCFFSDRNHISDSHKNK